jgi:hypothetical protein
MDYLNPLAGLTVTPDPGYVLKGSVGDKKIFINVCSSSHISGPIDENGKIRVPMSIGPIMPDLDSNQKICSVVDVVVGIQSLINSLQAPELVEFIVSSVVAKHGEELGGTVTGVKFINRKYKGEVRTQRIKANTLIKEEDKVEDIMSYLGIIPAFTIELLSRDGNTLDVLTLDEYKSTELLLESALRRQLGTEEMKDPSVTTIREQYHSCKITIPLVPDPTKVHLEIADERLVVRMKRLGSCDPFSIWFPVQMDPKTVTATYSDRSMDLCIQVFVQKETYAQ